MKFRQNQNIYITSNITFNCIESSFITTKWTILTCTPLCLDQTQFNQPIDTTQTDLFILAQTLFHGIYQLTLTVTIIDFPTLTTSSSVYIEIVRSTMITNIISYNTLMITHDYQQNLFLNPGEFSFDVNAITFNKSVSYQS